MKLFKYITILLISLITLSCNKENYHTIKFEVSFEVAPENISDAIGIVCQPIHEEDVVEELSPQLVESGYIWAHEWGGLVNGDKVYFNIFPGELIGNNQSAVFTMSIYIDGGLYSERKLNLNQPDITEYQFGPNDDITENYPIINFIYNE